MTITEALILGVVQGLTEFLPVSSSGHIVLVEHLMGASIGENSTAMSVLLHLGSLSAILFVFWRDLVALVWPRISWSRLALLVYVSIPAAIVGFTLKDRDDILHNPWVSAGGLLFTATILLLADRRMRRDEGTHEIATVRGRPWLQAISVGIAQAVAILPGISRSGSTVATALVMDWKRDDALRLSFLMGMIAIGGAGLLKARDMGDIEVGVAACGFISSLVFSLLGLLGLKFVLKKRKLAWFAAYCALAGVAALVWLGVSAS